MSSLKPELYWWVYRRKQRTMLVWTFLFVILLFHLVYQIPTLMKQKWELHNLNYSDSLFDNKQYNYREFLNWSLNIDEIIQKKQIIEWNMLHSKNPNNYKYIENYITHQKKLIGLEEFKFNKVYNFRNQWRNSVILNLTLTDKEKLISFISTISKNWYLWKNLSIQKEWWIYNWNIELVFDIK